MILDLKKKKIHLFKHNQIHNGQINLFYLQIKDHIKIYL
jgi:hypothetical protein